MRLWSGRAPDRDSIALTHLQPYAQAEGDGLVDTNIRGKGEQGTGIRWTAGPHAIQTARPEVDPVIPNFVGNRLELFAGLIGHDDRRTHDDVPGRIVDNAR